MTKLTIIFVINTILFGTFACSKNKTKEDGPTMHLLTKAEKVQNPAIQIKVHSKHNVKLWGEFTHKNKKYKVGISNKDISSTCGCNIKALRNQNFEFWIDLNKNNTKETDEMFLVIFDIP